MSKIRNFVTAGAMLLLVAAPAFSAEPANGPTGAAPGPGWGYGPGMMRGYGYGPGMMGSNGGGPGFMGGGMFGFADEGQIIEFVDGRLAFVKAELKVTEQQMPLWNAFADTVRANAKTVNERRELMYGARWEQKSLPERLDAQETILASRLEALRKTSAALKPLYAALDNQQKKVADTLLVNPMGGLRGFM
ncbi:MAG TPA: Spy/CpxP family protein refolding chaperone [Stellaceae bacterium]